MALLPINRRGSAAIRKSVGRLELHSFAALKDLKNIIYILPVLLSAIGVTWKLKYKTKSSCIKNVVH